MGTARAAARTARAAAKAWGDASTKKAALLEPSVKPLARASRALGLIELLVPKRIADEEIGDAMEVIVRMVDHGQPAWRVYLKVASTVFWVLLHTVGVGDRVVQKKTTSRKV